MLMESHVWWSAQLSVNFIYNQNPTVFILRSEEKCLRNSSVNKCKVAFGFCLYIRMS